jgi:histidinol-phosphatase (PHP family)
MKKPGKTNYHTHFSICDGKGEAEDYVKAALDKGFSALGFSSHAPLPYQNSWTMKEADLPRYLSIIRGIKEAYRGRIEIYLGLETDYIRGYRGPSDPPYPVLGLDYIIGSMHIIQSGSGVYREIDGPPEMYRAILEEDFHGDIRKMVEVYYSYFSELALLHRPTILGHYDLIKKNNPGGLFFKESEGWYRSLAAGIIPAVAKSGCIVEVNTGGLARKRTAEVYPSPWILRLLREAEVPIMLNSDAHAPENLDAHFDEALRVIRDSGYREVMVLDPEGWNAVPL